MHRLPIALAAALIATVATVVLAPAAGLAQGSNPFLYYPYFGTESINSYYDHQYPNYTQNGSTMRWDGTYVTYYDGHSGVDYSTVYDPILAGAAGTVNFSGWWSTNHESSYGLSTRIDHGNGYRTLYGHLSAILYSSGEWLGARWQLGTSGTTGNSSGPHLHFEPLLLHGGYWRPMDPYGWTAGFTDPWRSLTGAVNQYLWVGSPTTGAPPNYGETVVDNGSGFSKWCNAGGSCPYWYYTSSYGYGGGMWYTYSNGASADYRARWTPSLPTTATYEVLVHIPNGYATSHAARYLIQYGNGSRTVIVDQHEVYDWSSTGRWVSLGQHYFYAGSGGYVEVSDAAYISGNYTEPATTDYIIGVDAVKWIRRS